MFVEIKGLKCTLNGFMKTPQTCCFGSSRIRVDNEVRSLVSQYNPNSSSLLMQTPQLQPQFSITTNATMTEDLHQESPFIIRVELTNSQRSHYFELSHICLFVSMGGLLQETSWFLFLANECNTMRKKGLRLILHLLCTFF